MVNEDNIRITITIPKTLHELLKDDADYEDRSISNLASRILKQYYNLSTDE